MASDKDSKLKVFTTELSYQVINKSFRSIERFRSVEFNRDFNLNSSVPQNTEQKLPSTGKSTNSQLLCEAL